MNIENSYRRVLFRNDIHNKEDCFGGIDCKSFFFLVFESGI